MAQEKYNVFPYQNADPYSYGQLKEWAKENRKNPTDSEYVLRQYVRANQLGHKFLFQYIIGQYIVDFFCPDANLIIELDGGYHSEPQQVYHDEIRTKWLESMGYKVIRFTNEQVLFDIDNVLDTIIDYLK